MSARLFIAWSDFTRATDFQPGGAPDEGLTLTEMWGWAIVLPVGADTVYVDDVGVENHLVDDFESGAAPGTSCAGIRLGFCAFQDAAGSVSIAAATPPPAPVLPELGEPNTVMQVDLDVAAFAVFIHGFTNAAGDTWVPHRIGALTRALPSGYMATTVARTCSSTCWRTATQDQRPTTPSAGR